MKWRANLEPGLLAIALFLAPLIGGQMPIEVLPLSRGMHGFLAAVLGGPELPITVAAIVGGLTLLALAIGMVRRRVMQFPSARVGLPLVMFFAVLGGSVMVSQFGFLSFRTWAVWCTYGAVVFAIVGFGGRGRGPDALLWSMLGGCTLVALKGISEYGLMRHDDPTWRIFADWVNPNALGGMMLIGLFVGIGLMLASQRVARLAAGCAATACGIALVLTQSKGAYLCAAAGAAVLLAALARRERRAALLSLAPIVATLAVALAIASAARSSGGTGALTRVTTPSQTEQQSVGFRKLLWKGAARLAAEEPAGIGLGAFRYLSARPGITTQTVLAHNSYLQLAAEASILAPITLLVMLIAWASELARGIRALAPRRALLLLSVFAAVIASLGNGLVESNLYVFGNGFSLFALIGIGMLLGVDSAAPEPTTRGTRVIGALASLVLFALLAFLGWGEWLKTQVLGSNLYKTFGPQPPLTALRKYFAFDPDTWALLARYSPEAAVPKERAALLQEAARRSPSTRELRSLARALDNAGDLSGARRALDRALKQDPKNLAALSLLYDLEARLGLSDQATATARRLVAIEGTSYFRVRAIPELVPTETYDARAFLAARETNPWAMAKLLVEALQGYARYARVTYPVIKRISEGSPSAGVGGETLALATAKLQFARKIGREALLLYKGLAYRPGVDEVNSLLASLAVD